MRMTIRLLSICGVILCTAIPLVAAANAEPGEPTTTSNATTRSTLPDPTEDSYLRRLVRRSVINVGVSFRTDQLEITDSSQGGKGTLVNERGLGPFLTVGFENAYFGESRWGYTAVFGWTQIEMDKQKFGKEIVDLGTSAKGEFFFIAPSIYYMFGAKHYEGWYVKPGFAFGLGYLRTDGDVLLTSLSGNPRYNFDTNDNPFSVSVGVYIETGYKDWFARLQIAGPVASDEDEEISGTTIGLTFGYTFHPFRNMH